LEKLSKVVLKFLPVSSFQPKIASISDVLPYLENLKKLVKSPP